MPVRRRKPGPAPSPRARLTSRFADALRRSPIPVIRLEVEIGFPPLSLYVLRQRRPFPLTELTALRLVLLAHRLGFPHEEILEPAGRRRSAA